MSKSVSSVLPAFWNQRYVFGETLWVVHKIPTALASFLKRTRTRGTVLITGCGTDLEVIKTFADAGFEVTAIGFSTVAVAQMRKALGNFEAKLFAEISSSTISGGVLI